MKLSTQDQNGACVIRMQGKIMSDLDVTEVLDAVKSAIYENKNKVVLDLEGIEWLNSTGLGMLIAARSQLLEINGQLRLSGMNSSVMHLISLNKLEKVFDIHPTMDDALKSL
jgi:anti-sigma B factor antagonist